MTRRNIVVKTMKGKKNAARYDLGGIGLHRGSGLFEPAAYFTPCISF